MDQIKKGAPHARNGLALLLASEQLIDGIRKRGHLLSLLGPDGAQLLAELHDYLDRVLARQPSGPAPDSPHLEWSKDLHVRGREIAEQLPRVDGAAEAKEHADAVHEMQVRCYSEPLTGSGGRDDSRAPGDDRDGVTDRRRL
jgi:hypothetical protein